MFGFMCSILFLDVKMGYLIMKFIEIGVLFMEYWLLENCYKVGCDVDFFGDGFLIWYIDDVFLSN